MVGMCVFALDGDWLSVFVWRKNQKRNKTKSENTHIRPFGNGDIDNNQPPDTKQLWENYSANRSHIACRLSPGDVCVKYSYIYNDAGKVFAHPMSNAFTIQSLRVLQRKLHSMMPIVHLTLTPSITIAWLFATIITGVNSLIRFASEIGLAFAVRCSCPIVYVSFPILLCCSSFECNDLRIGALCIFGIMVGMDTICDLRHMRHEPWLMTDEKRKHLLSIKIINLIMKFVLLLSISLHGSRCGRLEWRRTQWRTLPTHAPKWM